MFCQLTKGFRSKDFLFCQVTKLNCCSEILFCQLTKPFRIKEYYFCQLTKPIRCAAKHFCHFTITIRIKENLFCHINITIRSKESVFCQVKSLFSLSFIVICFFFESYLKYSFDDCLILHTIIIMEGKHKIRAPKMHFAFRSSYRNYYLVCCGWFKQQSTRLYFGL